MAEIGPPQIGVCKNGGHVMLFDERNRRRVVGRLVRQGIDSGKALAEFPLETLREACELIDETVYDYLGAVNAVKAMKSYGSTAPDQTRFQIDSWKKRLGL